MTSIPPYENQDSAGDAGSSSGGTTFTPTKSNLYNAVKAILHPDTNAGVVPDDTNRELDISGGGDPQILTPNSDGSWPSAANNDDKLLVVPGDTVYYVEESTTTETPNTVTWSASIPASYNILGVYTSVSRPAPNQGNQNKLIYLSDTDKWQRSVYTAPTSWTEGYYRWAYSGGPSTWIGAYDTQREAEDNSTTINNIAYYNDTLYIVTSWAAGIDHQYAHWVPIQGTGTSTDGGSNTITEADILNFAKQNRTTSDRNKILGTSSTDENDLVLVDIPAGSGTQGPKGDKGDTGDTGPVGPQGPKGDKGDKGDTGPAGSGGGSSGVSAIPQVITPGTSLVRVGTISGGTDVTGRIDSTDTADIPLSALGTGDLASNLNTTNNTFTLRAGSYEIFLTLDNIFTSNHATNNLENRTTLAAGISGTLPDGSFSRTIPEYFRGERSGATGETGYISSGAVVPVYLYLSQDTTIGLELVGFVGFAFEFNRAYQCNVTDILINPVNGIKGDPGEDGTGESPTLSNVTSALGLDAVATANRQKLIQRKNDDTGYEYTDQFALDGSITDAFDRLKNITNDLTPTVQSTGWTDNTDAIIGGVSAASASLDLNAAAALTYHATEHSGAVRGNHVYVRLRAADDPAQARMVMLGQQAENYDQLISQFTILGTVGQYDYYRDDSGVVGSRVSVIKLQVTSSAAHIGTSTYSGTLTGEAGTGTVDIDSLVKAVTDRLLPVLPNAGSRNHRVPRFVGDTLTYTTRPYFQDHLLAHTQTADKTSDTWEDIDTTWQVGTAEFNNGGWRKSANNKGIIVPQSAAGPVRIDARIVHTRVPSTDVDASVVNQSVQKRIYARLVRMRGQTTTIIGHENSKENYGFIGDRNNATSHIDLHTISNVNMGDIIYLQVKFEEGMLWYKTEPTSYIMITSLV